MPDVQGSRHGCWGAMRGVPTRRLRDVPRHRREPGRLTRTLPPDWRTARFVDRRSLAAFRMRAGRSTRATLPQIPGTGRFACPVCRGSGAIRRGRSPGRDVDGPVADRVDLELVAPAFDVGVAVRSRGVHGHAVDVVDPEVPPVRRPRESGVARQRKWGEGEPSVARERLGERGDEAPVARADSSASGGPALGGGFPCGRGLARCCCLSYRGSAALGAPRRGGGRRRRSDVDG